MKKTVTIFMLVLMLVTLLVQPVAAAGLEAHIETKTTSAKPGDTIDFTITVSGDAACQSMGLKINIDPDIFEVVKGKSKIKGTLISIFDKERGFVAMFQKNTVPSGDIGTMTLRVKDDAPAGEAAVTFKTSAQDENNNSVPFSCNTVKIQIDGATAPTQKPTTPPDVQATTPAQPTTPEEKPTDAPVVNIPEETVGQNATDASTEAATAPAETVAATTGETVDTTAPDASAAPSAPAATDADSSADLKWGIIGAVLAVVIATGIAAYFFITKKRQK